MIPDAAWFGLALTGCGLLWAAATRLTSMEHAIRDVAKRLDRLETVEADNGVRTTRMEERFERMASDVKQLKSRDERDRDAAEEAVRHWTGGDVG